MVKISSIWIQWYRLSLFGFNGKYSTDRLRSNRQLAEIDSAQIRQHSFIVLGISRTDFFCSHPQIKISSVRVLLLRSDSEDSFCFDIKLKSPLFEFLIVVATLRVVIVDHPREFFSMKACPTSRAAEAVR